MLAAVNYHLILATAHQKILDLGLSNAGPEGEQHLTPHFDAEVICCGEPLSPEFQNAPWNIVLKESNAYSPAYIVHRIIQDIRNTGRTVRIFIYNLTSRPVAFSLETMPFVWVYEANRFSRQPKREYPNAKESNDRLDSRIEFMAHRLLSNLARYSPTGDTNIIAECVPGGTTTALNLALATGAHNPSALKQASSSADPATNRKKFNFAWEHASLIQGCVNASLRDSLFFDDFQRMLAQAARLQYETQSPQKHLLYLDNLIFGGGTQMMSIVRFITECQRSFDRAQVNASVMTTPFVMDAIGWSHGAYAWNPYCQNGAISPKYYGGQNHPNLEPYYRGYVKEGCGLGAMSYLGHAFQSRTSLGVAGPYWDHLFSKVTA